MRGAANSNALLDGFTSSRDVYHGAGGLALAVRLGDDGLEELSQFTQWQG